MWANRVKESKKTQSDSKRKGFAFFVIQKNKSDKNAVFCRAGEVLLQHGNMREESFIGKVFSVLGAFAHAALALDAYAAHLGGVGRVDRSHWAFLGAKAAFGTLIFVR